MKSLEEKKIEANEKQRKGEVVLPSKVIIEQVLTRFRENYWFLASSPGEDDNAFVLLVVRVRSTHCDRSFEDLQLLPRKEFTEEYRVIFPKHLDIDEFYIVLTDVTTYSPNKVINICRKEVAKIKKARS